MSSDVDAIRFVEARRLLSCCCFPEAVLRLADLANGSLNELLTSVSSVGGVEGVSDSEVLSSDHAKDSPDERGDCEAPKLRNSLGAILGPEELSGSDGIGLSGCEVADVGIGWWRWVAI